MRLARLTLTVLRNRLGAVPKPSWCTYLVTYRCNARCQMCDSWQMRPGLELTPAQVALVFRKLGRLDVVRLTGGEPFLRPDLPEIAAQVLSLSRPTVLHISTNGSFPDRAVELVRQCPGASKLRFMVSFDGLPGVYDRNRGPHVTFASAFETIRRLAELRATHGIRVSANHTIISPQSLADSAGLRAALASLRVEVHSVLAYADSAMYSVNLSGKRAEHLIAPAGYPLHPSLASANVEDGEVIDFVRRELHRAERYRDPALRWGKRYYLRGLLARLSTTIRARAAARGPIRARAEAKGNLPHGDLPAPRPHPQCVALRSHIRLLPDGRVPVCQFNTEPVGSLLQQSLPELWHGQPAAAARTWVDRCPGCWAECEVIPNAIYSGALLRFS